MNIFLSSFILLQMTALKGRSLRLWQSSTVDDAMKKKPMEEKKREERSRTPMRCTIERSEPKGNNWADAADEDDANQEFLGPRQGLTGGWEEANWRKQRAARVEEKEADWGAPATDEEEDEEKAYLPLPSNRY